MSLKKKAWGLFHQGKTITEVAKAMEVQTHTAEKWKKSWAQHQAKGRAEPARLDAKGTAKGKTRLLRKQPKGEAYAPGMPATHYDGDILGWFVVGKLQDGSEASFEMRGATLKDVLNRAKKRGFSKLHYVGSEKPEKANRKEYVEAEVRAIELSKRLSGKTTATHTRKSKASDEFDKGKWYVIGEGRDGRQKEFSLSRGRTDRGDYERIVKEALSRRFDDIHYVGHVEPHQASSSERIEGERRGERIGRILDRKLGGLGGAKTPLS